MGVVRVNFIIAEVVSLLGSHFSLSWKLGNKLVLFGGQSNVQDCLLAIFSSLESILTRNTLLALLSVPQQNRLLSSLIQVPNA
jgi:hypothetical protein